MPSQHAVPLYHSGFRNHVSSEALPGALPRARTHPSAAPTACMPNS